MITKKKKKVWIMSTVTIFDQILEKKIPADIVYEDDNVLAFKDINPQAPVHILVIPKKKITDFGKLEDSNKDDIGLYFQGITKVIQKLDLSKGYRVVFNKGEHGQQTVNYIHAHILGGRQLKWPPG